MVEKANVDDASKNWASFWEGLSGTKPVPGNRSSHPCAKNRRRHCGRIRRAMALSPPPCVAGHLCRYHHHHHRLRLQLRAHLVAPQLCARIHGRMTAHLQKILSRVKNPSHCNHSQKKKKTKRSSRFTRQVLLYRSMQTWVDDRDKVL